MEIKKMESEKKIYATLKELSSLKEEIIQQILTTLPFAEENKY